MTTAIGEMEGVAKNRHPIWYKSHENFKNGHEEGHLCRRFRGGYSDRGKHGTSMCFGHVGIPRCGVPS